MLFYKLTQRNGYIYSLEIQLSNYKFTVFPLVYIALYNNGGFKIVLGLFNFFIEIVKINNDIDEKTIDLFNVVLNKNKDDTRR